MEEIKCKTLELLSQNCRISTAEIAKRIKKPRHLVAYHRDQFHKKHIILNHEVLLNYSCLGYTEYLVYLKIFQYSKIKQDLQKTIAAHPNVRWYGEVFPNYTVRICVLAKDIREFEVFMNHLEELHGKHISKKDILLQRSYLKTESYSTRTIVPKKNYSEMELNDSDKKLITSLDKDASQSLVTLSKESGLSIETVRQKIKRYQESGLIENFSTKFDIRKLGHHFWCNLMLKLNNMNHHEERLKTLIHSDVKFGRTRKTFGTWNIEMTVFGESYKHMHHVIEQLEDFFGDDLESHEIHIYKDNLLPTRLPNVIFG